MQKLKQQLYDLLPRYYDESPEVDAIMHANAIELDATRSKARDLLEQLFVRTATWGLSEWERVLALPPAPRADLEFRRQRILAKLAGNAPATVEYLTELVNVYVPSRDTRIIEHNTNYSFEAEIPLESAIDTEQIRQAVEEVKPAHLAFNLTGVAREVIVMTGSAYSFEVPYRICNTFRTEDAQGVGVGLYVGGKSAEYSFEVPYLICGEFYAKEGY